MNDEIIKIKRDEGSYRATPTLKSVQLITSAAEIVDRAIADINSDSIGVINIIDKLGYPINDLVMQFYKSDGSAGQFANIQIFAGRSDNSSLKKVFQGSIEIGSALCANTPDGTDIIDGLWAAKIISDGNDHWGARVIGNACNEIAQLCFDLRGCRCLYVVIDDTDVKAVVSGY
ncbi:MAG: hypothetical protein JEZ07_08930 [Phycisphaerae bacterium]|nr:hypothetical protein [Phycisphaerae bacterium]